MDAIAPYRMYLIAEWIASLNRHFILRHGNRLFGFQEIKAIIDVAQIFGCVSWHNERYLEVTR
jgi:hypothetical protein